MKHLLLFRALKLLQTVRLQEVIYFSIQCVQPLVLLRSAQRTCSARFILMTYPCEGIFREPLWFHCNSSRVPSLHFGRSWLRISLHHMLRLWNIVPSLLEASRSIWLTFYFGHSVPRPVPGLLTDGVMVAGSTFLINSSSVLTGSGRVDSGKSISLKVTCFSETAFMFDVHKRGRVPPQCPAAIPVLTSRQTLTFD